MSRLFFGSMCGTGSYIEVEGTISEENHKRRDCLLAVVFVPSEYDQKLVSRPWADSKAQILVGVNHSGLQCHRVSQCHTCICHSNHTYIIGHPLHCDIGGNKPMPGGVKGGWCSKSVF